MLFRSATPLHVRFPIPMSYILKVHCGVRFISAGASGRLHANDNGEVVELTADALGGMYNISGSADGSMRAMCVFEKIYLCVLMLCGLDASAIFWMTDAHHSLRSGPSTGAFEDLRGMGCPQCILILICS